MPKTKKPNISLYQGFLFVCVIQYRNWPLRSTILNAHGTNASYDGFCTRTHTNEAFSCWFRCNSFRVDRARRGNVCFEDQAKTCSPTDQPVRKFRDGLGIDTTMKTFFSKTLFFHHSSCNISQHVRSMEWCLRRVVPSTAVTTHAKPHAQQQLARDLEVERAAMGQRCRPQSFGEVQRGNPQPR